MSDSSMAMIDARSGPLIVGPSPAVVAECADHVECKQVKLAALVEAMAAAKNQSWGATVRPT